MYMSTKLLAWETLSWSCKLAYTYERGTWNDDSGTGGGLINSHVLKCFPSLQVDHLYIPYDCTLKANP
uniref:AlNc14C24G2394 protein n=1 Tax=Albugo laibachii Nc14 TaxID=890382 RepID=F0W694_9STRA|nr:AlNc14C24G2394 [Albugo laibachii Nc14]|eukprot:CCA16637.1 AlNc14C24G2394 [Albugo laibachii Nc14]